jgi:tungstate transport system substrate-binding protein
MRFLCLLMLLFFLGCMPTPTKPLRIAVPTTLCDSGLLKSILPEFTNQTEIETSIICVGSGQALELAKRGDVDLLFAHSPLAEQQLITDGVATSRTTLFTSRFLLIGPATDPAHVANLPNIIEKFQAIAKSQSLFISRNDQSGTHIKEIAIWKQTLLEPTGHWYLKAGVGMGATLRLAQEKQAYVLTDEPTYFALKNELQLVAWETAEFEAVLLNPYSLLLLSNKKHTHLQSAAAEKLLLFFQTAETQQQIAEFGSEKFGKALFQMEAAK